MEWCVSDIVTRHGAWNVALLNDLVPFDILPKIIAHPAPLPHDGTDERYWPSEASGNFSVGLAYQHLKQFDMTLADDKWQKAWKLQVPERVRYFIWHILHGKLATKYYCGRWGNGDTSCNHCRSATETIFHVLRDCPLSMQLWNSLIPPGLRPSFYGVDLVDRLDINLSTKTKLDVQLEWCNVWSIGCHCLWGWRN